MRSLHQGTKTLKLYELLTDTKSYSSDEIMLILYGKIDQSNYKHLKNRLHKHLLNHLISYEGEEALISEYGSALYTARKNITQLTVLLSRGAYLNAEKLLKETSELCERFELYPESLAISEVLLSNTRFKESINSNISIDFDSTIANYVDLLTIKSILSEVNHTSFTSATQSDSFKLRNQELLRKLQNIEHVESEKVRFNLWLSQIFLLSNIRKYEEAILKCNEVINLLETSIVFSGINHKGGAYLLQSQLYLKNQDYLHALRLAQLAKQCFNDEQNNFILASNAEFYAVLRLERFSDSLVLVVKMLGNKLVNRNLIQLGRWHFFKKYSDYLIGDISSSAFSVATESVIAKDKTGWYLGERILEMMVLTDEKQWDILGYRVIAFYQHLQRHKKSITGRPKLIHKIFKVLLKQGGNFKITAEKCKNELASLKAGKEEFYWDPQGYELIRFDDWFAERISKTSYQTSQSA